MGVKKRCYPFPSVTYRHVVFHSIHTFYLVSSPEVYFALLLVSLTSYQWELCSYHHFSEGGFC